MIPIVLAADNNYAYPLIVALFSIVRNKKEQSDYKFYLLVTNDFSDCNKSIINNILERYCLPTAEFIVFNDEFKDIKMKIEHISNVTYYRLLLPEILKSEEKVIYLDVDVLVKDDLNELYNSVTSEYLIGGVKAAAYYYPKKEQTHKAKVLNISAFDQYVNAGVLIMNLKLMREKNVYAQFLSLLDRNFQSQDQDILNSACYGSIKILPPCYNAMTKYGLPELSAYDKFECLSYVWNREEWNVACKNPIIIHFADKVKPWDSFNVNFSKEWWECAREAGVEQLVFKKNFSKIINNSKNIISLKRKKDKVNHGIVKKVFQSVRKDGIWYTVNKILKKLM